MIPRRGALLGALLAPTLAACTAPDMPCTQTPECPADQVCHEGRCRSVCNTKNDCDPGESCRNGVCLPGVDAGPDRDATLPDTARPDLTPPDASQPDTAPPDTFQPDLVLPDTTRPDVCCASGVCDGFDDDPLNCGGCGVSCDDGNPCTDDSCTGGECVNAATIDRPCLEEVGGFDDGAVASSVFVEGRYAYVADMNDGLEIVDISDPALPVEVGQVGGISQAYDVWVQGGHAFVVGYGGLHVMDVSDPAAPAVVFHVNPSSISCGIFLSGSYAYVARDTAGMDIYDISTPTEPVAVGNFRAASSYATDVVVVGSVAYLAYGQYGFTAVNVADPANPVEIEGAHVDDNYLLYGIDVVGSYAYVTDRNLGLIIIDIADINLPVVIGGYDDGSNWGMMVEVIGSCAYYANDWGGVKVLDLAEPASPAVLAAYSDGGRTNHLFVVGNYIYVADDSDGLEILRARNLPCH